MLVNKFFFNNIITIRSLNSGSICPKSLKETNPMFRKITLLVAVVALLGLVSFASADPVDGCYATASPLTVNEDESFTVTVQCENISTDNNVFGFQLGTQLAGDYDVPSMPEIYTAGTFADPSTGVLTEVVTGANLLTGYYAVTRKNNEVVNTEDFTLGSYALRAEDNLTGNGSVIISLIDEQFILSDIHGSSLTGWLRDVHDVTVTITNLDLAWLSGDVVVRSDVDTISNLSLIELMLGNKAYSASNVATFSNTFTMDVTHRYDEEGEPGDGTLNVNVSADMSGHLMCSTSDVNLGDTGSATDVTTKVGVAGTITLLAGDADNDHDIDNADATLIGANIGTSPFDDRDINGDTIVNILDLVHVGRNFDTPAPTSCGTGVA